MSEVSTFRLYLLRAAYLFIVVGLGFEIWPGIFHHEKTWTLMHGVACSLLAAVSVLAVLGIRYPLTMLPLLLFELVWKSIWLIAVVGSYVVLGIGFAAVVRNVTNSTQYRPYVWAGLTALVLNLAFALAWQGTDLERYFPSLPMQALLLGVAIAELKKIWPKHAVVGVGALILVIAAANVIGNFHRFLASDSFAQQWFRAAHKNARAGDLLIVSGNRKQQLSNPHDSNFPQVMVVSNIIAMFGNKWQSVADERIDLAKAGGHSIFIGDSVLDRRSVPRDGYSFKQFPEPSAAEIADKFAPLRANSVAFSVLGERVWNGK